MAAKKVTPDQIKEALLAVQAAGGTITRAAAALKISRGALEGRLRAAKLAGATIPRANVRKPLGEAAIAAATGAVERAAYDEKLVELRDTVAELKTQLLGARRDSLDAQYIRTKIIGLRDAKPEPPIWMLRKGGGKSVAGVPTLFLSDFHWGEVVDSGQIGGVNEFNMSIANARLRTVVEKTTHLLKEYINPSSYPGIVVALGGDMVSGDIHDELSVSNEQPIMPVVVDLWGKLIWAIETLAGEFGKVFVPCVTGNHGRNTMKIRAKGRHHTSFDWLLYQFLAKHFENDDRVQFLIPDGPDAYYKIYGHRYLLTHGDQFRGGDGLIGALGPIVRGDHKKRSRNSQIDMGYDTMLLGHWHQLIQLERLIVNGSLKGYDEYAYSNNFGYEPARQGLWLTHPDHGITFSMPVIADRKEGDRSLPWIGWK